MDSALIFALLNILDNYVPNKMRWRRLANSVVGVRILRSPLIHPVLLYFFDTSIS